MVSNRQVIDKEVRKVIAEFPQFTVLRGGKHLKIVHPITGHFVTAPNTGSDWRGPKNLRSSLRFLAAHGYNRLQRIAA